VKSTWLSKALWATFAAAASLPACGGRTPLIDDAGPGSSSGGGSGGGSSGGFPYSGPSCSSAQINDGCWQCIENSCGSTAGCITSECNAFFTCFCACQPNDDSCLNSCAPLSTGGSCESCVQSITSCEMQSCQETCSGGMSSGGGGGGVSSSSGGGGSVGGGSGGPSSTVCSGSANSCPNGNDLQFCETTGSDGCSAYVTVGSQTFPCVSCMDLAACTKAAVASCQ
jgi:hypothetical protein